MPSVPIPQAVVDKDHELEGRHDRATEALAKHRWHHTLDPSGPGHSFAEYGRAVERSRTVIHNHAKGYALYVERQNDPVRPGLTLEDAFRLVVQSVEQQEFSEAIAEGSGQPVSRVARGDNAVRRREIIERARQREERRGGNAVDHAREIASEERRVAEASRARRERDRQRRSIRYVAIEGHLAAAQRRLTQALREADGVDFSADEMELIRDSLAKVRAVLNLLDMRMAGEVDIDWDAELTRLSGGE